LKVAPIFPFSGFLVITARDQQTIAKIDGSNFQRIKKVEVNGYREFFKEFPGTRVIKLFFCIGIIIKRIILMKKSCMRNQIRMKTKIKRSRGLELLMMIIVV